MSLLAACGAAPEAGSSVTATSAGGAAEAPATATAVTAEAAAIVTTPTPAPTPTTSATRVVGQGNIAITMWVQDFGPAITMFEQAAQTVAKKAGNVSVTVQPVPYPDLMAKILPSVAAGTDADIMMGYTDWYVATDVSKLFLPLDEYMGGRAELERIVFPSALTTLDTPQGKTFYIPWAAGIRAAAATVNVKHYKEKNLDYAKFATFEDFVAAGKQLTVEQGGKMTRAGLSPYSAALSLLKTWIWQMGGDFYNKESGKWNFSTQEAEAAAQKLYDLWWKDKVTSFELFSNEYEGFSQGLISTQFDGAWTAAVQEAGQADLKCDVIPTPKITGAKQDVVYPEHMGVITVSKRLAKDERKLQPCIAIVQEMLKPEGLLFLSQSYSGSLMSKQLYDDPRIMQTKYGPISKRAAEGTWPRARFPQDHVANQGPAQQELYRALRKELSIKEALTNMNTYLNEQESQARERLKG
jgi:ABC-type glycerol-3-phosphate transport system substrate-binding protein